MIVVDYAGRADTPMIEGRDLVARLGVERRARRPELDRQRGPCDDRLHVGHHRAAQGAVHVQAGLTVKLAAEGASTPRSAAKTW